LASLEEVRNPQSSPEIIDNRSFASAWNNTAFCIWTKGAELLVDPYSHSLALTNSRTSWLPITSA